MGLFEKLFGRKDSQMVVHDSTATPVALQNLENVTIDMSKPKQGSN